MPVKKSGKYRTYHPKNKFFSKFKLSDIVDLSALTRFYKKNRPEKVSLAGLGAKKLKTYTVIASAVLTLMVVGLFGTIVVFAYFSRELPNPTRLLERSFELSTRFYDRNDKLIYEVFGDKNRTLVKMEDVNPYVTYATLSTEDSEFYLHQGYSLRGMARAVRNTFTGEGLQGGSTLTQQVIKNTLLTQDRTLVRKIKEMILSLQLENRYSKDEIIQMYLNETPYGGQNYGIYSASKAYFNKLPKDLTVAESAYLAGLPQRPSYYSQFGVNPEAGIERKDYVLYLMRERGWIAGDGKRHYLSQEDYDAAKNEELKFETSRVPLEAPHFVFYAKQYLIDILGEEAVEKGGLKVKTSVDLDVQKLAQETVTNELEKSANLNVWNGAMVVLDPKTGQILAMVGSKGYNLDPQPEGCVPGTSGENSCKFDPYVNVTLSDRQPGSAIKPVTYATMLAQGYSAAYPFLDMPISFEGSAPDKPYVPENYDGIFRGVAPLRRALGNSLNIPAVEALKIAGIDNMIDQAEKMGITTFKDRQRYGLALTLGGGETKLLELTGAYSVFATEGKYHKPVPIIEVQDSTGRVVYKPMEPGVKALEEGPAFLISDILSDDGARSDVFGTGSLLNIPGHTVAVKTGTTDDKRDNYAIGYTPAVVVGVWVGNSNNEKMNPYIASGISGASPIWNTFMKEYLKGKADEKFKVPSNVEKFEVDKLTGGLPFEGFDTRSEWFVKGTEPTAKSDWFQRLEVCKIDGRIANDGCKDAGETDEISFVRITAPYSEWQPAVDAWVKEKYKEDDRFFPPLMQSKLEFDGDEVSNKDDVNVEIVGVKEGQSVPLNFRLNVEVSAYNDIKIVRIYMDGDKVAEDDASPYGYNFELKGSDIGSHEFEATVTDDDDNKGSAKIRLNVVGYARQ
ncbi:hypothetical protein A2473_03605 [candidate division WWE3 bacterium RIFOXYC2_FULL_42_13]|uniref:Uncharacterized protein n=1 Tax=candidate division WWE3 bacterium TaxID=2053526 RepID=A0A3D0ZPD5_UNCKA|nr:MAG: hypothetical protein A2473_03605 [candidate division WWE3 bacterium RIFOXYC2_FULL_42_13]OGC73968.1 MAG: hypothetical protein A2337_01030 [candidate division WWE3 bacterium RIFOXYB2_FULL_43_9]HCC41966.1 hypothetical protein [candidate division WWE3 bacterium]